MRKVNIRRFTQEGSTTTATVLEEAEAIVQEHLAKGGLVVDEKQGTLVTTIEPDVADLLFLDPIIGG